MRGVVTLRLRGNDGVLETRAAPPYPRRRPRCAPGERVGDVGADLGRGVSMTAFHEPVLLRTPVSTPHATALNATGSLMSPSTTAAPPPATQARKRLPRIPARVSASCAA